MDLQLASGPALIDQSPHKDAGIEWWFVQGSYQGPTIALREFMISFFRHKSADGDVSLKGFLLLSAILDPVTGRKECLSQIDSGTVASFVRQRKKLREGGMWGDLVDALAEEINQRGPPRPIRLESATPSLTGEPLAISWLDFALTQTADGFQLRFIEPESRRECLFELKIQRPPVHLKEIKLAGVKTLEYVIYPRLQLSGHAGGQPIEGQAWLDHQWGNASWFVSPDEQVLGWQWFGVNLESGPDIMVMVHYDVRSGEVIGRYAVVMDNINARICQELIITPLRQWESPSTWISYPISCRLEIPEIALCLDFQPTADDQEVPVFGVMRAIWQGAGRVTGRLADRQVTGHARMELHGWGYVCDFKEYLRDWIKRLDMRIEGYFPKIFDAAHLAQYVGLPAWRHDIHVQTEMLATPLWDLLGRGGKHWRPLFGILLLEALGVPAGPYEQLVAVMCEMAHTGALIIDDIEDSSAIRRGDQCIHLRYGLDVAINAANTAYFLPHLALRDHPSLSDAQRLEGYRILSRQALRAHLGQGQDIYWSRNLSRQNLQAWMNDSLDAGILQAYADKTGALVEAAAEAACVIALTDEPTRRLCAEFARNLGVAFQIVDDVLDFSTSRCQQGAGGKDLSEGKLTFAIIRALERLPAKERSHLEDILCTPELRQDARTRAEAIELVRASGALPLCRQEARKLWEGPWRQLAEILPPSEPKILLRTLCTALMHNEEHDGDELPGLMSI